MHFDLKLQTSNGTFPWFWRPRASLRTDWRAGFEAALRVGYTLVEFKVWRA